MTALLFSTYHVIFMKPEHNYLIFHGLSRKLHLTGETRLSFRVRLTTL